MGVEEAFAETLAALSPVSVPLADVAVVVPPMWAWPPEAVTALLSDDVDAWAHLTLDDDAYQVWLDTDPTLDESDQFITDWQRLTGQNLPTIARMTQVLADFGDQLAADLMWRGVDVRDLWRPEGGRSGLTFRLLAVLHDALPGESAVKTAQANALGEQKLAELAKQPRDGFGPWSNTDLLLAELIDAVNRLSYITIRANSDKKTKVKEPEPVHRPGLLRKHQPRPKTLNDASRRLLEHMRTHQGALPDGWVTMQQP